MDKVILWALPTGETDRLHERPLTSFPLTSAEADKVQAAASKDGWHGFRRQIDDNQAPNFVAAITGNERRQIAAKHFAKVGRVEGKHVI